MHSMHAYEIKYPSQCHLPLFLRQIVNLSASFDSHPALSEHLPLPQVSRSGQCNGSIDPRNPPPDPSPPPTPKSRCEWLCESGMWLVNSWVLPLRFLAPFYCPCVGCANIDPNPQPPSPQPSPPPPSPNCVMGIWKRHFL